MANINYYNYLGQAHKCTLPSIMIVQILLLHMYVKLPTPPAISYALLGNLETRYIYFKFNNNVYNHNIEYTVSYKCFIE